MKLARVQVEWAKKKKADQVAEKKRTGRTTTTTTTTPRSRPTKTKAQKLAEVKAQWPKSNHKEYKETDVEEENNVTVKAVSTRTPGMILLVVGLAAFVFLYTLTSLKHSFYNEIPVETVPVETIPIKETIPIETKCADTSGTAYFEESVLHAFHATTVVLKGWIGQGARAVLAYTESTPSM